MAYVDVAIWGPYKIATVISRGQALQGTITNVKYFNGKDWVDYVPNVFISEEELGLKCTVKNTSLYNQRVNARCIFTFARPDGGYVQRGHTSIKELAVNQSWDFFEAWMPDFLGAWLGQINLQMEPI